MPVTAVDLGIVGEKADPWSSNPWATALTEVLDSARLSALISTPDPEQADLDIALALVDLVRDDLQLSGTSGGEGSAMGTCGWPSARWRAPRLVPGTSLSCPSAITLAGDTVDEQDKDGDCHPVLPPAQARRCQPSGRLTGSAIDLSVPEQMINA